MQYTGKAHKVGANIDTDAIIPARFLVTTDEAELGANCMAGLEEGWVSRVSPGDIMVGGPNFGCGSSREHAAITLLHAGVGAVLAESFARIFYRNALNLALPLMVCPGIQEHVGDGDELEVDLEEGVVRNLSTGESLVGQKISGYAMEILKSGGIKPLMREKMKAARK